MFLARIFGLEDRDEEALRLLAKLDDRTDGPNEALFLHCIALHKVARRLGRSREHSHEAGKSAAAHLQVGLVIFTSQS